MKRFVPIFVVAAGLSAAVSPAADGAPDADGAATPSQPRLSLASDSGLKDGRSRYVLKGQSVRIGGVLRPYVKGQRVVVKVNRGGKRVVRKEVGLAERKDGSGEFYIRFRVAKTGAHSVVAEHVSTPELAAVSSDKYRLKAIPTPKAGGGAGGLRARLLQAGLREVGVLQSGSGRFDRATGYAVAAFRNYNGMGREGYASRTVFEKLFRHSGGFKLRYPKAWKTGGTKGKHVEFDKSRQVIVLARYGKPERLVYTSSGTSATPTIFGRYKFYRKSPGTNARGMVHSSYFIRGYAIHGYPSVPTHPASHGCLRIPIPLARSVFDWIDIGDPIASYR